MPSRVDLRPRACDAARTDVERLLVAAARPRAASEPSAEIARIAARPGLPWDEVHRLAAWHALTPRLARALELSGVTDRVPGRMARTLESVYAATMARGLLLQRELQRIVAELRRHDVEVMLLKGAALVPRVHRNLGVRPRDDLDLLVAHDQLERADAIVRGLGYQPGAAPPAPVKHTEKSFAGTSHHHLPVLVRADGHVAVELHHALGSSYTPLDFDVAPLWARAVPTAVGDVPCLRPADEDLLVHLGLHFLVDRAELCSGRALGQLCDVAALIDSAGPGIDWVSMTTGANEHGYAAALALALGSAGAVLDVWPPDGVLELLAPPVFPTPTAVELVERRVLRGDAWTTLEQLDPRAPSVLQLLPPPPRRWTKPEGGAPPPFPMFSGYVRWVASAVRIACKRGEIGAERRVAERLDHVIFPHGRREDSESRWSVLLRD